MRQMINEIDRFERDEEKFWGPDTNWDEIYAEAQQLVDLEKKKEHHPDDAEGIIEWIVDELNSQFNSEDGYKLSRPELEDVVKEKWFGSVAESRTVRNKEVPKNRNPFAQHAKNRKGDAHGGSVKYKNKKDRKASKQSMFKHYHDKEDVQEEEELEEFASCGGTSSGSIATAPAGKKGKKGSLLR